MEDLYDGIYDKNAYIIALLMDDRSTKTLKMIDGRPQHVKGTFEQWHNWHTIEKIRWSHFNKWAKGIENGRN